MAAFPNYCVLMSWLCFFECVCRYEAANTAGCYTALCQYILAVRLISVWMLLMPFVHVCIGINYDRACVVVAKLFVVWWFFGRCIMMLSCCLFTQWKYEYWYMSFINTIDLAHFPLGYPHCFEGSVQCRLASLAEANTLLYTSLYDVSVTVFIWLFACDIGFQEIPFYCHT